LQACGLAGFLKGGDNMVLGLNQIGRVWTHENRISSDGNTNEVALFGLPENALELFGELTSVDGKTKLNGIFAYNPFQEGREVTTDGFDQVQLYNSITNAQTKLMLLGIDVNGIVAGQHGGKRHPISAHANAVTSLNAWYSPQKDDLTFGTNGDMKKGLDKWHLASDSDVSIHETGHLLLDHINKKLGSFLNDCHNSNFCHPGDLEPDPSQQAFSEGRSIHEGFSDALAALYADDPEMSEDFGPNIGKPPSKTDGLRNVDNNLTLSDVGTEEHDRGQVYSAFFWSIKKGLSDPDGQFKMTSRDAADLTLLILFNHASNYTTGRPTSKDFVDAVIRGIDALQADGKLSVNAEELKKIVVAEGTKRKLLKEEQPPPEPETKTFNDVERIAGPRARFVLEQQSKFRGGFQDIYQQQYQSVRFGTIDVVGGNVFVNKNSKGKIVHISARDVRTMQTLSIDESVSVTEMEAIKKAGLAAGNELKSSASLLNTLKFALQRDKKKETIKKYKDIEMQVEVAKTALQYLDPKFKIDRKRPKMVIFPGSNELHYEIQTGLSRIYVNAKTGETKFMRDVIAN